MGRSVKRFALLSCLSLFCGTDRMLLPAVPHAATLTRISCAPMSFTGLGKSTCTIEFSGAVSVAQVVSVTSTAPLKVPAPRSIVVPRSATKTSFTIRIGAVDEARSVTLTAMANGISEKTEIYLNAYAARILSNPPSLTFGSIPVGRSIAKSIVLTSTGTAPLTIRAIDSSRAAFKASGVELPLTLDPGKKRILTVTFAPRTVASLPALLKVTSNASTTPLTIGLRGAGSPSVLSSLTCAEKTLKAGARNDICTVGLTGPANGNLQIHLESNSAAVRVPSLVTVANRSSGAAFSAAATWVSTAQKATITATEDRIAVPIQIQLTAASASLSQPAPIAFDDVAIGSTDSQELFLLSSGSEPITINSVTVTGAGVSVTGITPPLILNPGAWIAAYVDFAPIAGGQVNGSITILTTASNGKPLNVPVSGAGTVYQANLMWSAPKTSDPIAGYNIFRAEAGSTSYVQVNADLVTSLTYMDQTVVNGTFYIYYIETVDESGVSSTPSAAYPLQIP